VICCERWRRDAKKQPVRQAIRFPSCAAKPLRDPRGALSSFTDKQALFAAVCETLHAEAKQVIETEAAPSAFDGLVAGCLSPQVRRILILDAPASWAGRPGTRWIAATGLACGSRGPGNPSIQDALDRLKSSFSLMIETPCFKSPQATKSSTNRGSKRDLTLSVVAGYDRKFLPTKMRGPRWKPL
jgi:hypothetical protein